LWQRQKVWDLRARSIHLMLLLARHHAAGSGEPSAKTDGLSVFLVDMRRSRAMG